MAETNARKQQDIEILGQCGIKNEEKTMEKQQNPFPANTVEEPKQSSETEGNTQQAGLMENLLVCEVPVETNEAEQKCNGLFNPVLSAAMVEPKHPSDSEGKTHHKASDGEGEKEEEKKKSGSVKNETKGKIVGHYEKEDNN